MITQKPILLKLDAHQLELLDNLCKELGCNRNKLLNFFVRVGIEQLSSHYFSRLTMVYSSIKFD